MIGQYLPILFVFVLAAGFALVMLGLTHVIGPRINTRVKLAPYESGVDPAEGRQSRLNVRYFVIGLVFIIFDLEVVFMFPWAVIFKEQASEGAFIFFEMLFFLVVLLVGYIYVWRKGVFEWE